MYYAVSFVLVEYYVCFEPIFVLINVRYILYIWYMRYMMYFYIWYGIDDIGIRDIWYTSMVYIYMVIKTEQFYIRFKICFVILNLFLLTYEHIYNVMYNGYMQLTIGSIIRVYYRTVWFFYHNKEYLAYSTSFCLICSFQVLKQGTDKTFYLFDKIKVHLRLDDTSPRCR